MNENPNTFSGQHINNYHTNEECIWLIVHPLPLLLKLNYMNYIHTHHAEYGG